MFSYGWIIFKNGLTRILLKKKEIGHCVNAYVKT